MDMQEKGEERAMRQMEMLRGQDDPDIDPNNIWGSVLAQGVGALVKMFREASPHIAQMIAGKVGKPAEQVSDADLAQLHAKLSALPDAPQHQLAAPPPAPRVQPQPRPAPPQASTIGTGFPPAAESIFSEDELNFAPTIQPPPPGLSTQPESAPPPQPVDSGSPQQEGEVSLDQKVELDLVEKINEVISEYMLVDLKTQRQDHDWPHLANELWGKDFKDKFAAAFEHADRIKMLKEKANPTLWAQAEELMPMASANAYNFGVALTNLVNSIKGTTT
jgi:hypothetical protein